MNTRKMVMTSFFIALGIIIPQAFHMFGGPGLGSVFLPMHYPVIIGGMILGPVSGMLIGGVSVVVGIMLGMPPINIGMFMIFELMTYGLVAGLTAKKMPMIVSLIITMLSGRVVSLLLVNVALSLFAISLPPVFGKLAMFAASLPGMAVQVFLIPVIMLALKRALPKEALNYE